MRVKANAAFRRRDTKTTVKRGETFECSDQYGAAIVRAGLATDCAGIVHRQDVRRKVIRLAPERVAVEAAPEVKQVLPSSAGGAEQPSSASPPARASRRTTATGSAGGRKRTRKAEDAS